MSLPSKFVEQRPDMREYSALLHEATAQIGVATANMLPQITLTGSYGGEATSFSNVFSPASVVWSLAASATQPIFKGGQLLHQRRAAGGSGAASRGQLSRHGHHGIPKCLRHSLCAQRRCRGSRSAGACRAHRGAKLEVVQVQYKSGAASYLQVLSAEQTYQTAAVALVKAKAQRYADTAALFQALGGGWWNRNDVAANTIDSRKEP